MNISNLIENESDYEKVESLIIDRLERAKDSHEFVNVDYVRNIGKTFALLKFAEKHNYVYVSRIYRKYGSDEYEITYWTRQDNKKKYNNKTYLIEDFKKLKIVIDEDFNLSKLDSDVDINNLNIVTGYQHKDKFESDFKNGVVDTLKHEVKCLVPKIEKARDKDDTGTYKNLIIAFKEVIDLLDTSKERKF